MKWWIEHVCPGQKPTRHIVDIPDFPNSKGYTQGISICAFRTREIRRRFPLDKDGKPLYSSIHGLNIEYCSVRMYDEEADLVTLMRTFIEKENKKNGTNKRLPTLPKAKVHASLWDFYAHIGYDHKRKRYVTA